MSRAQFNAAFNQARQARLKGDAGDTFNYNNKSYHSYTKDELDEMGNADYNELAGNLGWKERTGKNGPARITDAHLSMYSTRSDATTMKQKQMMSELKMAIPDRQSAKDLGEVGRMTSGFQQADRNQDPEFMDFRNQSREEDLMYRQEKDRTEKSAELTDDMEGYISDAALMGASGGFAGLLGKALMKGMVRKGGSELLPKALEYTTGLGSRSKLFKNLVKHGDLTEISKSQPYLNRRLIDMR